MYFYCHVMFFFTIIHLQTTFTFAHIHDYSRSWLSSAIRCCREGATVALYYRTSPLIHQLPHTLIDTFFFSWDIPTPRVISLDIPTRALGIYKDITHALGIYKDNTLRADVKVASMWMLAVLGNVNHASTVNHLWDSTLYLVAPRG